MKMLSPDLIERVNRVSHEQKRLSKVLSTLQTLPEDIERFKADLSQLNLQFRQRPQPVFVPPDLDLTANPEFERDTNEAERLEAELGRIKAFEDDIDGLFLEEVLQLRGKLAQTGSAPETKAKTDTGYIIFYRNDQHETFEWSEQDQQWCAKHHGSCYPSRIAVEQQFTALKEQWADLALKIGRR